jgi:hypothetical protein
MRLWDLETGVSQRRFEHPFEVCAVAPLPDGLRALSGASDGIMRLWDLEKRLALRQFKAGKAHVLCVAALPDGERALSGQGDGSGIVWHLATGIELHRFPEPYGWGVLGSGATTRKPGALRLRRPHHAPLADRAHAQGIVPRVRPSAGQALLLLLGGILGPRVGMQVGTGLAHTRLKSVRSVTGRPCK